MKSKTPGEMGERGKRGVSISAPQLFHTPAEHEQGMREELESVRQRLQEAEEILRAIRDGEVDALAIQGNGAPAIRTLSGAEHPYRVLVETMSEGAVTLDAEGRVLYSNPAFDRLLGLRQSEIQGTDLRCFIRAGERPYFEALLARGLKDKDGSRGELELIAADGAVPVLLSFSALTPGPQPEDAGPGARCACLIVTDLREQKRHQQISASEQLTNSVLDQAAEAIVVCDQGGTVLRANQQAQSLCGRNPLLSAFDEVFPLYLPTEAAAETGPATGVDRTTLKPIAVSEILHGEAYRSREVLFWRRERGGPRLCPLLLSAAPLRTSDKSTIGCVVHLIDITERKHAEQEQALLLSREQQARAQAQAADQAKDVFLATLSHELRTPLNAVLGWARLLRDAPNDKIKAQAIEVIERNARVQAQLIDDILDISRIASGKLALEMGVLDVGPVLSGAIESVRLAADAKGIRLLSNLGTTPGPSLVLGDAGRLQQVMWNLLSNATKFTARGGAIEVRLGGDDQNVVVTVTDTGQGISSEFLPFVFERFRQADGSTTRRFGGLGLGLAIVRHLVEMHGGSVSAASPGVGHGSTFSIQLPRAAAHIASATTPSRLHGQLPPGALPAELLAGVRVLIVDDQPDTLDFLAVALAQQGAVVATAPSAAAALRVLQNTPPDVLISDIAMPGGDGYHLVQELRALQHASQARAGIPAIALTAFARSADAEAALRAGFQRHLAKPVDVAELAATVAVLARAS